MRTVDRREFLGRAVGSAAAAALAHAAAPQAAAPHAAGSAAGLAGRRPNIVLVLTDDQGYADLGRHGNAVIQTPNLDRMYDESLRFTDFHVSPTCSPTRCSIMTGRHEFKSGVSHTIFERERMSLKATTLADVLRSAGYATGIFGKWHLGDEAPYRPDRRGFDETFIHGAGGIGQGYAGSCGDAPGNRYFDPVILHNGTFVKTQGYCTDVFFGKAVQWIGTVRERAPFFACITPNAPHAPLDCPEEYERRYRGKTPDPTVAKFYGMITNIDDNVGTLRAALARMGIERDTLVIFMNDNGGTAGVRLFNAGMRGNKGTARNGGTRAMSLWNWPAAIQPGDCGALTAHLDLFPTLAGLAGAKLSPDVSGRLDGFSLLPLLQDPGSSWHGDRMLFTHVGRWEPGTAPAKYGRCSVRWRRWLMVREELSWTLYDLAADPGETAEVSSRHPDVVARLERAYDRWWAEVLPGLENENAYRSAPGVNPFKELYWRQYGGPGPNKVPPPG